MRRDDLIVSDDYRRMFAILEDAATAADLPALHERLQEAFARHLGWSGVAVLTGFTPQQVTAERPGVAEFGSRYVEEYRERWWNSDPLCSPHGIHVMRTRGVAVLRSLLRDRAADDDQAGQAYVDRFLHRHGIADMVGVVIGAGTAGAAFLGVPFTADHPVGPRELLIVHKLRQQLSGHFEHHLALARPALDPYELSARERDVAERVARGGTPTNRWHGNFTSLWTP